MKTTHKPSQELQPAYNTKKIPLCPKRHKTVSFKTEKYSLKLQNKHKQFAVKYDIGSSGHGVFIVISMQKTLHTRLTCPAYFC